MLPKHFLGCESDDERFEKGDVDMLIPAGIVEISKKENSCNSFKFGDHEYLPSFVRIVQKNLLEIIFKNVPCPPKGQLSDFYFEHPVHGDKEHWHFKRYSLKIIKEPSECSSSKATRPTWEKFAILEDDSQLFFPNWVD